MIKKIGFKLIVVVGITAVLIIGVYSTINIHSQSMLLLEEAERHANQLSETVISSTQYGMLLNQREHVHKIIDTIGKQSGLRKVRIFNKEGEIIYSSQKDDIGTMVDKDAESCYACHSVGKPLDHLSIKERTRIFKQQSDASRVMGIINPIYNERTCWTADCHAHSKDQTVLGVLDVTIGLQELDTQILFSKVKVVIFAVIAIMAISFIIGFFVKRWVDRPVKELVKATDHVGIGNLNYIIKKTGNDELGVLAKSFNQMTKKLSEMRMQLSHADKMASLGRLAAGVAHEINNPLTGVLTYSSYLLKRTKDNPELHEDLAVIVRETKRSREIVKGLLDFARASVPKKNNIKIQAAIMRALDVINEQLVKYQIKIEKDISPDVSEISADADQLQQVFINLLTNAIDAIGQDGGTIWIYVKQMSLSAYGFAQVKHAACSNHHSLMDDEFKIDYKPSIRVKYKSDKGDHFIRLDPVYGLKRHQFGGLMFKNKVIRLYCPECDISLMDESKQCPLCGTVVYALHIPEQGVLYGCLKTGCLWQQWDDLDRAGERKYLEISFSDNGCGIPPENMNKIFDPFYSTKDQKGTGLGLSVVWGIIDAHNGTIQVNNRNDRGTTFIIRLPVN
ncbi:MAG: ATP-binding protein [Chlamydiota bacterium]|nr:ATP-binding protein [Chlamydiota bacterium]